MRARAALVAGAVLVALGLVGCGTAASETAPSASETATAGPAPTAGPTPTASRTPTADYECETVLPVERAATALGVSPDRLSGIDTSRAAGSADLLARAARENGGLLGCGWEVEQSAVSLQVRVLQDASATAAPILAAGAGTPSCEGALCRVDVVSGATWLSLEILSPDATADATLRLATLLADDARRAEVEPVVTAAAVPCAGVLSDEQLVSVAGLAQPVPGSGGAAVTTISAAASARAGLTTCAWLDASAAEYSGVTVDILPAGAEGWRALSLKTDLPLTVAPVDGIGERALAGCSDAVCEVDALQSDTWFRVTATGDAERARAITLAVLADAAAAR